MQPSGSAFYDVGKRDGRKLRVETPYLVGVVKGTQFNVVAQDKGATISLYEGLLEIRAADDSAVVNIKAGEVASRRDGDRAIGVIHMNDPSPRPPRPSPAPATGGQPPTPTIEGDALMAAGDAPDQPVVTGVMDTFVAAKPAVPPGTSVQVPANLSPVSSNVPAVSINVPAVTTNVDMSPPAPAISEPPSGASSTVNTNPVIVDVPAGNVSAVVTVGGADLGTGTEDTPDGSGDHSANSGHGNGNGNAGSNSSGNGTGNSGNGDNSNQGREDDGFHGLAHKK